MTATAARLPPQGRRRFSHDAVVGWSILAPALVYYTILAGISILLTLIVSLLKWDAFNPPQWVGLANYARYLRAPYLDVLSNTFVMTAAVLILQVPTALVVAYALNLKLRGVGLHRAAWFIPQLTSAAVMAQVFFAFINPYGGVFNRVLEHFGQDPVIWQLDDFWMRTFIVLFTVWRGIGLSIIFFLAGLQSVPRGLYEAAAIDGANERQRMIYVALPMLRPTMFFVVVTATIQTFQMFEPVLLLKGPPDSTKVLLVQIFEDAFVNYNFGVAAAGAMVMAVLLLGLSLVYVRLLGRD